MNVFGFLTFLLFFFLTWNLLHIFNTFFTKLVGAKKIAGSHLGQWKDSFASLKTKCPLATFFRWGAVRVEFSTIVHVLLSSCVGLSVDHFPYLHGYHSLLLTCHHTWVDYFMVPQGVLVHRFKNHGPLDAILLGPKGIP